MPELATIDIVHRRNWLASHYFERERRHGPPWLVPSNATTAAMSIGAHDWTKGTGPPEPSGVPIGVIQHVGNLWLLDVWTARRDIGGPPADNAWRSRLAMRPWNIFLAQILQFQDQATVVLAAEPTIVKEAVVDPRDEVAQAFFAEIKTQHLGTLHRMTRFQREYRAAAKPYVLASKSESLRDRGIDELPPAGYLRTMETGDALRAWLGRMFGEGVDLRICRVRADSIAGAVEGSQHLDRIPLDSSGVKVDILVPYGLKADAYGWLAFVRRREVECDEEPAALDKVDVYVDLQGRDADAIVKAYREEPPSEFSKVGEAFYPAGGWHYPGPEAARAAVTALGSEEGSLGIVAIASTEPREPLAAQRGDLFAASLDGGRLPAPVWSRTVAERDEAIVVFLIRNHR